MVHIALLGDSVFNNGIYIDGGPDVATQLREVVARGDRVTLLAIDRSVTD